MPVLEDLNTDQRAAAMTVSGPVCVLAGAGTGKTRVISHRVAYAIASGAVRSRDVLVVTFTDKAAAQMRERLAALGHGGVAARTFHSAALLQLRHFWPRLSDRPFPEILASKIPVLARILRGETSGYRFMAAKDLADAIEWAKVRRITPASLEREAERTSRTLPAPSDVVVRLWRAYERSKDREGAIDFEDMLTRTVELLERVPAAAEEVRSRYRWFSVDEYQDTNAIQEALLRLWLGDRDDVCVVGDPDQTIYSFTGATSDYLTTFPARYKGTHVFELRENYRSSPAILALANRLATPARDGSARLIATEPPGPSALIARLPHERDEAAAIVARIRDLERRGLKGSGMAILVRVNAQIPPLEEALTRAGIAHQVRGERFYARRDVRDAVAALRALSPTKRAISHVKPSNALAARWTATLGFDRDLVAVTDAARERQAALEMLLAIADDLAVGEPRSIDDVLADVDRRDRDERDGAADGVTLSTIHRAKGLEWDAVLLPAWEEGFLPHASARGPGELAEERRLAYVALTRARRHLWIGYVLRRRGSRGGEGPRTRSRFLDEIDPRPAATRAGRLAASRDPSLPFRPIARLDSPPPLHDEVSKRILTALHEWRRTRAARDGVPAYVVATDALLGAIADGRPKTADALLAISGIGPARLARYGTEILAIVEAMT